MEPNSNAPLEIRFSSNRKLTFCWLSIYSDQNAFGMPINSGYALRGEWGRKSELMFIIHSACDEFTEGLSD